LTKIIDNHLKNPQELKDTLLRLKFYHYDNHPEPKGTDDFWIGNWEGLRTAKLLTEVPHYLYTQLSNALVEHFELTGQGYRIEMYARFNSDKDTAPYDIEQISRTFDYVGLLNLTESPESSITIYNPTEATDVRRPFNDLEEGETLTCKYNQLIILDSAEFIKWRSNFGDSVEGGDLTLVMLFEELH